jgi:hypothetical protein
MFERYTEPARKAIYYAWASMRMQKDPALDSIHLLRGLIWRDRTRAEVLFQLRDKFPQYLRRYGDVGDDRSIDKRPEPDIYGRR